MVGETRSQSELRRMMDSLGESNKNLIKIMTSVLRDIFSSEFQSLKDALETKDRTIKQLGERCDQLEQKVKTLESHIDELEQYGRRKCLIFSGHTVIPAETTGENTTDIICNVVKEHLKIIIKTSDISVSHRLGRVIEGKHRPIIVKLVNRSLKYDLISACAARRPQLYINESLTPRRRRLLNQVLMVRRDHKNAFKSCYTSEGRIVIRLKNSTVKHIIHDEPSLIKFLEKYPLMHDTYKANQDGD